MKKFLKSLKNYFVNLYRAIFNIQPKVEKPEIEESKYKGDLPDIDRLLERFDVENIKKIIEQTPTKEGQDNDIVQQQFIANRKAINEYKDWYSRLVGYNKPPELLQRLIDADLRMDRVEMDKIFYEMYQQDLEDFRIVKEQKRKETNILDEIERYNQFPKAKKLDLREILMQAKEKL